MSKPSLQYVVNIDIETGVDKLPESGGLGCHGAAFESLIVNSWTVKHYIIQVPIYVPKFLFTQNSRTFHRTAACFSGIVLMGFDNDGHNHDGHKPWWPTWWICPMMLNNLNCTFDVSFSRFHFSGHYYGHGLWSSWYRPVLKTGKDNGQQLQSISTSRAVEMMALCHVKEATGYP